MVKNCLKILNEVKVSQSCLTLRDSLQTLDCIVHGLYSLSLLQGIFPTQGSNPGLLHCRQILYELSHKGSPKTLNTMLYIEYLPWRLKKAQYLKP